MPLVFYQGSISSLHRHFQNSLDQILPDQRGQHLVLVPSVRLARVLKSRLATDGCEVMALDEWLERRLSQHITRIPQGAWEMLSRTIPETVIPRHQQQVPGLCQAGVAIVRQARLEGVPPLGSFPHDRLPWDRLWQYLDQRLSGPALDDLRMYEYAAKRSNVLGDSSETIHLYGFSHFSRRLWALIGPWSQRQAIQVWALQGTLDDGDLTRLRRFHGELYTLPGADSRTFFETLPVAGDAIDGLVKVFAKRGIGADQAVIAVSRPETVQVVLRSLAVAGWISDHLIHKDEVVAHWRMMLRVAFGVATLGERQYWQEMTERLDETERWGDQLRQAPTWEAIGQLVQTVASDQALLSPRARPLEELSLYDQWNVPLTVDACYEALTKLFVPNPTSLPVLLLEDALWVPTSVLVFPEEGVFPRPIPRTVFDRDQALRDWLLESWPESQDPRLMNALEKDGEVDCWFMRSDSSAYGQVFATMSDEAASRRIRAWYEGWRESPEFTAYQGQVLVNAMPYLPTRFSASLLEDFGRCPLSFLLSRVIGARARDEETVEVDPRLLGQWAHRVMEIMVREKVPLSQKAVVAALTRAIGENPPPRQVAAFHIQYQRDRLASELYEALWRDGWNPRIDSHVEVPLQWDFVFPMAGRIDRLDFLPEGRIRLVDYKTGKLVNPSTIDPAHLQLPLYWETVSSRYKKPVTAEFFGISQKAGFRQRVLEVEDPARLRETLTRVLGGMRERIEEGLFYPLPDPRGEPCRLCDYRDVCPARVGEYAHLKNERAAEFTALWKGDDDGAR